MSSTPPDFRNDEPAWVRYATMVNSAHNKFYEVRVDLGDDGTFYLTKRWGARPDAGGGQIKVEPYQSQVAATSAATSMLNSKIAKGYQITERPRGADGRVAHEYGHDWYADEDAF